MLHGNILVLGGAASGKSAYAEGLFDGWTGRRVYIATSQAFDAEMEAKIAAHIARRGGAWHTIEAPFEAASALDGLTDGDACLLDCATLWLSNHLLQERSLEAEEARLLDSLRRSAVPVVVVSNEVGQGIVPEHALGRQFREAQGRLNIALAKQAETVVQVVAGLPRALKGELP